jgi:hypothetical protein
MNIARVAVQRSNARAARRPTRLALELMSQIEHNFSRWARNFFGTMIPEFN